MLQVVSSTINNILITLEVSFTLLENIFSTGVTHDDRHLWPLYFYSAEANIKTFLVHNLHIFVIG